MNRTGHRRGAGGATQDEGLARGADRAPGKQALAPMLQRKNNGDGLAHDAAAQVERAASSSGAPLPGTLQRKFEASLGADLSGVRVHTGSESASAADSVSAKAYTVGSDIHFGAGQYDPSSRGGEELLAHEVAHTVQQSGGAARKAQFKLEVSQPGDALELEADSAASAMVAGQQAQVTGGDAAVSRTPHAHALPPDVQRLVTRSQGNISAVAAGELVQWATTLDAALGSQPERSPQRQQIARALMRIYHAVDAQVRAADTLDGPPQVAGLHWEPGSPLEGLVEGIAPFSMIDAWAADAGEAAHHRHRTPRPRPAASTSGGGGGTPTPTPTPTPAPTPTPDATRAVTGQMGSVSVGQIVPGHSTAERVLHTMEQGAEVADTALSIAELVVEMDTAFIGGLALGGFAAIVGPLLQIVAGDHFFEAIESSQHYVYNFCASFAHTVRGEGAHGGPGSAEGVRAGQRVRTDVAARNPAVVAGLASIAQSTLYSLAFVRIAPHVEEQLVHSQRSRFLGIPGTESDAVPGAEGYARGFIESVEPGHTIYNQFGGGE
jgi:hypothetical protein